MATLLFRAGPDRTPRRLGFGVAVSFRDLSDHYSEHGIELVKGHVEGSLVCRRR